MKAMILRDDLGAAARLAHHLAGQGFATLCAANHDTALAMIHADTIDLIVLDERVGSQLTHRLALSAERRNPYLSTIILTDQQAEAVDDLYALIPSLYALLGTQTGADLAGRIALCAISDTEGAALRIARQMADDGADLAGASDFWGDDAGGERSDDVMTDAGAPQSGARWITRAYAPSWGEFAGLRPLHSGFASMAATDPDGRICA